jgi:capsular exopolysaccharide synthesis family protein
MISGSYEQENNPLLGVLRFVRAVRERKIIPILCIGAFCLAGIISYVVTPEFYEARAVVLLNGVNNRDVRLLASEPVLGNVVQELADEKISELETLSLTSHVTHIRSHLSVKSPGGRPDILNLRYTSRDPQAATAILNKIVTVYVSYLNHKMYASIEMGNFRARLHRVLSKDISTLLGDAPEKDVQTTNRKDARIEKSRDVQNKLTLTKAPSELMTPGKNFGSDLKKDLQSAGPIIQVTLALSDPQRKLDDATNPLEKSSNSKSLGRESINRLDVLQKIISNLEILKNSHKIKDTIVLSRATVPAQAASPLKLTTILPILVFLGFGFGLVIIYVVNAVDDRFYSPCELSRRLGIPVLEIIQKKVYLGRFLSNRTPDHHSFKDVELKEFEALRVTLDLLGEKSNVLVISSVHSNAGKTTVSAGLATAFSQSGKRTLLIDSDYHHGTLSRLFCDRDEAGLSRILSDEISFADAIEENIQCIGDRGLELLPRGKTNNSSTNLLTTKRFSEFISWCETRYDQLVIDAPAALDSCDASILGEAADGIILVITPNSTTRSRSLRACCNLESLGCRLIGVVANQLEPYNSWSTNDGYRYQGVEPQYIHQTSDGQADYMISPKSGNGFPVKINECSEALEQDAITSIHNSRVG